MNLAFLNILEENKRDTELKPLLDIGTCDFPNFRKWSKYGGKTSNRDVKKLLNAMFKGTLIQILKSLYVFVFQ